MAVKVNFTKKNRLQNTVRPHRPHLTWVAKGFRNHTLVGAFQKLSFLGCAQGVWERRPVSATERLLAICSPFRRTGSARANAGFVWRAVRRDGGEARPFRAV